jgi:hypothetical protein
LVSVSDHHGAKGQAHDEQSEGLQAIEVAQMVPPAERGIDYSKRGDRRKPRRETGSTRATGPGPEFDIERLRGVGNFW